MRLGAIVYFYYYTVGGE